MPIVTHQSPTLSFAFVVFGRFAAVEESCMLTVGKNSFNFEITVGVFRKHPAFNCPVVSTAQFLNNVEHTFPAIFKTFLRAWMLLRACQTATWLIACHFCMRGSFVADTVADMLAIKTHATQLWAFDFGNGFTTV